MQLDDSMKLMLTQCRSETKEVEKLQSFGSAPQVGNHCHKATEKYLKNEEALYLGRIHDFTELKPKKLYYIFT